MAEKNQKENHNAKSVFHISTTPAQDAQEARDALKKETNSTTEGVEEDMPDETTNRAPAKETTPTNETEQVLSKASKKNGQLLVAGRRPIKGLNTMTIVIDKDVEELIKSVVHPSSNKSMALNELLRIALVEIQKQEGIIIKEGESVK